MAARTMVGIIIALIVIGFMVLTFWGFFAQAIFGGPEYKAAEGIADALNGACMEQSPYVTTFNIFLPDFKSGAAHKEYFYIAISNYSVLLRARKEANDITVAFIDFAAGKSGEETLKEIPLKACKDKDVQVCILVDMGLLGTVKKCNNFQFESNEGMESLTFVLNRTYARELVMNYTRAEG